MSNVLQPQQPPADTQDPAQAVAGTAPTQEPKLEGGKRTEEDEFVDIKLADDLSQIIETANEKVIPVCDMIRKHIDRMDAQKEEDRDEDELVKQVKPLLEQAEKILYETHGSIQAVDRDKALVNRVRRHAQDHTASPEEQRLAVALQVLIENVEGTVIWAKDKLESFPKAKRDLGPLLDALGQPITQIVGGVGLLLAGVLNLLGNLLSGLGLDSLLKGIIAATGLDKIYKGLGLEKWLKGDK